MERGSFGIQYLRVGTAGERAAGQGVGAMDDGPPGSGVPVFELGAVREQYPVPWREGALPLHESRGFGGLRDAMGAEG